MKDTTILLCLLLGNRTVRVLIQDHYTMTSFPLNDQMDIYYVYFPSVLKNIFHPSIFGLRKSTWDPAIPRLRAQTSLMSSIPPSPFQSRMSLFVTSIHLQIHLIIASHSPLSIFFSLTEGDENKISAFLTMFRRN